MRQLDQPPRHGGTISFLRSVPAFTCCRSCGLCLRGQMMERSFAEQNGSSTAKSLHATFLKSWGQGHSIGWLYSLSSSELPFWRRGSAYSFHRWESLYLIIF
jgi:hypothetical protein